MIDSAQWWLYEQTLFRQLSEIYRLEEFMGPREARMQNEKEPPSPFLFHSQHLLFSHFTCSFRDAHFEPRHYGASHLLPEKIELCLIMQSSCEMYGVYNKIDRELSDSSRPGVGGEGLAQRALPFSQRYLYKEMPCLCAPTSVLILVGRINIWEGSGLNGEDF